MKTTKLASAVAAGVLLFGLAGCSDSVAKSCSEVRKVSGEARVEVCLTAKGEVTAVGLQPGSTLTVSSAVGVQELKVGSDGSLADRTTIVDTSGKPVTISFEGAVADGSPISGELTQPG